MVLVLGSWFMFLVLVVLFLLLVLLVLLALVLILDLLLLLLLLLLLPVLAFVLVLVLRCLSGRLVVANKIALLAVLLSWRMICRLAVARFGVCASSSFSFFIQIS